MDAPSWADQWGAGGIGAREEEEKNKTMGDETTKKNNMTTMDKVKAAATVGAQKIKNGTSFGIKWIKTQCQKKTAPK
ncbi:hypothetical protein ACHQM5_004000 [Ranunculus cassubicifolius]